MIPASLLFFFLAPAPQCTDPAWLFRVGSTQAYTTIQDALDAAGSYAAINPTPVPKVLVDAGIYSEQLVFPANVDLILEGNRYIPRDFTISSGSITERTIRFTGGQTSATRVIGFQITGELDQHGIGIGGGGIHIEESSPTIEWNIFSRCSSSESFIPCGDPKTDHFSGGAIAARNTSANIRHNIFEGCEAPEGHGGAILLDFSSATVRQNRFTAEDPCSTEGETVTNRALRGGAIASRCGDASYIIDNLFRQCAAKDGGAIYVHDSSPSISGNTILESLGRMTLPMGGGIYLEDSFSCITSNVIAFNGRIAGAPCKGAVLGGGVYSIGGGPSLINNTIYGNYTQGIGVEVSEGGGVFIGNGSPIVINNLIRANAAQFNAQVSLPSWVTPSGNVIDNICPPGGPPCDDPDMIDPWNFDFHLRIDSLLLDAGEAYTGSCADDFDFDGNDRVVGFDGRPVARDIGADEYDTHLYFIGDSVAPMAGGVLRVVDSPNNTAGVWYSVVTLSPGYEVPFGLLGDFWFLGLYVPPTCDFDELDIQTPLFLQYNDGTGPALRTIGSAGYAEWLTAPISSALPNPFTLYFQSLVQWPLNVKRATDVEAVTAQ